METANIIVSWQYSNIINIKKSNKLGIVHFKIRSLPNKENKSKIEFFLSYLPQISEVVAFF